MRSPAFAVLSGLVLILIGAVAFRVVESSLGSDPDPTPMAVNPGSTSLGGASNGSGGGAFVSPAFSSDAAYAGYASEMCLAAIDFGEDIDSVISEFLVGRGGTVAQGLESLAAEGDAYIGLLRTIGAPSEVQPYHDGFIANVGSLVARLRGGTLGVADIPTLNFTSQFPPTPEDIRLRLLSAAAAVSACGQVNLISADNVPSAPAREAAPSSNEGSVTGDAGTADGGSSVISEGGGYRTYVGAMCSEAINFGSASAGAASAILSMRLQDPRNEFPEKMEPALLGYISALRSMSPPTAVASAHLTYISRIEGRLSSMRSGALAPTDAPDGFESEYPPLPADQVQLLLAHPDATPLCEESRFFHQ